MFVPGAAGRPRHFGEARASPSVAIPDREYPRAVLTRPAAAGAQFAFLFIAVCSDELFGRVADCGDGGFRDCGQRRCWRLRNQRLANICTQAELQVRNQAIKFGHVKGALLFRVRDL